VADKVIWEWIAVPEFSVPVIFLFDAIGRIIVCFPVMLYISTKNTNEKSLKSSLKCIFTWDNIWRVVLVRSGLQFGFMAGGKSMQYIGPSTQTVMCQTQVLITALFTYLLFKKKMTAHQVFYGVALTMGAIAFKVDQLEQVNKDFIRGFIMNLVSVVVCSLFFVLTESLLKQTFEGVNGWHKQFIIAVIDVPVEIIMIVFDILWDKNVMQMDGIDWDMMRGVDGKVYVAAANCVLQGLLMYFLFDWIDAVFVNLMFVIQTACTYPVILIIKKINPDFSKETFAVQRCFILIFTVICCMGYNYDQWLTSHPSNSGTEEKEVSKFIEKTTNHEHKEMLRNQDEHLKTIGSSSV
jgi:drug/metabolite transporter (DMT)-like permease